MNTYGLIGASLSHSFSKKYFTDKFEKENITNSVYELFELKEISEFENLIATNKNLKGLNVTIPYKQNVMAYLSDLDGVAARIGAVNVIKILANKTLKGYNSDYYGFKNSLINFINAYSDTHYSYDFSNQMAVQKALILGNGGAAQAVKVALEDLGISYYVVSQRVTEKSKIENNTIPYEKINDVIEHCQLIINTTPLGMYPNISSAPPLPYSLINSNHFIFDLVYNPTETLLMKKASQQGAKVCNGLEMLHLQAEKAWEIWNL